jgi:Ca2+-binding EF-hand superfamily protein
MPERTRVWLLAALVAVLGAADAEAQGRTNLPGGNNDRRGARGRREPAPTWNVPEAEADKALPPDDSFFKMAGGGPVPLGPGKRAGKSGPAKPGAGKPGARKPGAAKPGAGAKPAPPADPMKAADQVTATADHLARLDETEQLMLREHFHVCDLDENGWLSLREAEVTLALDRNEFRRTEANKDGRMDASEFAEQKQLMLARLGARPGSALLEAPVATGPEPLAEPPLDGEAAEGAGETSEPAATSAATSELSSLRPADLVTRYDADGGAALDAAEIERFFADSGLTLLPELVVDLYDRDDSGGLEAAELYPLAWMAAQRLPAAVTGPDAVAEVVAAEPDDSATEVDEPPSTADATARTLTGLTHFGRLDPDRDGFVTEAELRKLQSPVRLEIRLRAVLSGMDQDGDGRLSEAEFRASMGDVRR